MTYGLPELKFAMLVVKFCLIHNTHERSPELT